MNLEFQFLWPFNDDMVKQIPRFASIVQYMQKLHKVGLGRVPLLGCNQSAKLMDYPKHSWLIYKEFEF